MPSNNKVHNLQQVDQSTANGEKLEPLNEELANGPLARRHCTDILCCMLFLAFIGGMIGVAGYAITKGNPDLIGRGYDADGKMCGISAGYEKYSYLYFPVPWTGYLDQAVCLSECPATTTVTTVKCLPNSKYVKTKDACETKPIKDLPSNIALKSAAGNIYLYATNAYLDRICVPAQLEDAAQNAYSATYNSDLLEQWINDIRSTWQVIACCIGLAFLIGFVYMVFLRYCSGVLTWVAILAFIAGTGVLGWRFYQKAKETEAGLSGVSDEDKENAKQTILTERIIAYVCWGVAGFTILAVLCMYNRIRLAIAILKAAADFIKDTPSIFIIPPLAVAVLAVIFTYWAGTLLWLVSSGSPTQLAGTAFGTFAFGQVLKKLMIYHLFGLLWFNAFVMAGTQFVIASATALWYFSQGTGQNAPKTVRTSLYRLLRYHFGSIAFGSLILAIIQMVRLVLAYVQSQAKKLEGKDGKVVRFVLSCLQCYLACFEKCIKFLNKNAYIQIALSGKNFCGAAKDAFSLILRNPLRMSVVTSLGGIFVLFGKVFIASLTALAGFLVITNWSKFSTQIHSPFLPTLIIFMFAYCIGSCFMTVYGLAADTILACFILDEEINSKKNAPPRHCPESLREFLNNNVKK